MQSRSSASPAVLLPSQGRAPAPAHAGHEQAVAAQHACQRPQLHLPDMNMDPRTLLLNTFGLAIRLGGAFSTCRSTRGLLASVAIPAASCCLLTCNHHHALLCSIRATAAGLCLVQQSHHGGAAATGLRQIQDASRVLSPDVAQLNSPNEKNLQRDCQISVCMPRRLPCLDPHLRAACAT